MKRIEDMTEREMLMELMAEKRLQDRLRAVKIAFWIAVILLLVWLGFTYVPRIIDVYNKWNDVLQQIQETGNKVNGVVDEIKSGPLQSIQSGIDSVKSGVESVKSFLSKLGF
jgi:predicted PurR-regulated permease PerM